MNFNEAEKVRNELREDINHLKSVKMKTQQSKFNNFVKEHESHVNTLIEELESLQDEFNLFKLHTLSSIEHEEDKPRKSKCVTSPFTIYIQQK